MNWQSAVAAIAAGAVICPVYFLLTAAGKRSGLKAVRAALDVICGMAASLAAVATAFIFNDGIVSFYIPLFECFGFFTVRAVCSLSVDILRRRR